MSFLMIDYVHYNDVHPFSAQLGLTVESNSIVVVVGSDDGSHSLVGSYLLPVDNSSFDFNISVDDFETAGNTLTVSGSSSGINVSSSNSSVPMFAVNVNLAKLLSGNDDFDIFVSNTGGQ